ncbi:MAG: YncE family protein [Ignavibacteria bacterium]|nr:YncE family protein [Ignavibacteria bacterium]
MRHPRSLFPVWSLVFLLYSDGCIDPPGQPSSARVLAISHSALNRLTFFDLDRNIIVGALPAQKLPHDMLVTENSDTLYVINSGAQCISTYYPHQPEFWKYASAFMQKDSAHLFSRPAPTGTSRNIAGGRKDSLASGEMHSGRVLNPDPVQSLPLNIARHFLTDTLFPGIAARPHAAENARSHASCYDCHDRSVGGKPFGPVFNGDRSRIYLVHLAHRTISILNARTLAVEREIALDLSSNYSPVAIWINPHETLAFVTCRNEIGTSQPGVILVLDLQSAKTRKTIPAGIYPWHLVPDETGTRLFVNNFQSSRISILDIAAEEIVDSIIVRNGPAMMQLAPGEGRLYISCFYTDDVLVVNTATKAVEHVYEVDTNPTSLALSPDGDKLYVLCGGESSLNVIDLKAARVTERYPLLFGAYAFQLVHIPASLLP